MKRRSIYLESILKEALGEEYSPVSIEVTKDLPKSGEASESIQPKGKYTVDQILKNVFKDKAVILGQNK